MVSEAARCNTASGLKPEEVPAWRVVQVLSAVDASPNNTVVAQKVHSEEKQSTRIENKSKYFCNINSQHFQYLTQMFDDRCDGPFTSSRNLFIF